MYNEISVFPKIRRQLYKRLSSASLSSGSLNRHAARYKYIRLIFTEEWRLFQG